MPEFRFYHPVEVRYGDLDPQGHVNNARYLTYLEQARIRYVQHLGLWRGGSFLELGMILADIHVTFRSPILFEQAVRVGVRVARLGNKSFTMEHVIEEAETHAELAVGTAVLVAYDYQSNRTVPIPEDWRAAILSFENLTPD